MGEARREGGTEMKIIGTKARDALVGSTGDDFLSGRRGADILISNGGDDTMKGGRGRDTFVFFKTPGDDEATSRILDFNPSKDRILIVAEAFDQNVTAFYDPVDSLISLDVEGSHLPVATIVDYRWCPDDIVIGQNIIIG
jgi:Ca2+-binding RTX toxin-like protein